MPPPGTPATLATPSAASLSKKFSALPLLCTAGKNPSPERVPVVPVIVFRSDKRHRNWAEKRHPHVTTRQNVQHRAGPTRSQYPSQHTQNPRTYTHTLTRVGTKAAGVQARTRVTNRRRLHSCLHRARKAYCCSLPGGRRNPRNRPTRTPSPDARITRLWGGVEVKFRSFALLSLALSLCLSCRFPNGRLQHPAALGFGTRRRPIVGHARAFPYAGMGPNRLDADVSLGRPFPFKWEVLPFAAWGGPISGASCSAGRWRAIGLAS